MNLNELNPTQIILLTLLVSFTTSIATGIVTVSLVNQAPAVVTDTIHKVYEKTIEKIVPGEQTATVIENNKTIIVSEEDFVIDAVNKNSKSLIRIYTDVETEKITLSANPEKEINREFVAMGLFLTQEGDIVAQNNNFIVENIESDEISYYILNNDEKIEVSLQNQGNEFQEGFVFMKAQPTTEESFNFNSIEMGNSDVLKLGQSIILLGGEKTNMILSGIISNLTRDKIKINPEDEESEEKIIIKKIETDLHPENSMLALIDLNGNVIGIKSAEGQYLPINTIAESFNSLNTLEISKEN